MKKKTKLIVCAVWLVSVIIPFLIAVFNLKYPSVDMGLYGLLLPALFIFPVLGLLLTLLFSDDKKGMKRFTTFFVLFGFIIYILYISIITLGFTCLKTPYYPLISETEDINNYLVVDEDLSELDHQVISSVFPEQIPENADNVRYRYFSRLSSVEYEINAAWNLSDTEYQLTKEKILIDDSCISYENNCIVYTPYFDTAMIYYDAEIRFFDSNNEIQYALKKYESN